MATQINQQMSMTDIVMLAGLSLLWGGSFFFVEILIAYLPPLTIVTCRVGFAALGLWAIVLVLRTPLPTTQKQWGSLFIIGLLNNAIPFCLIVWGQTQISSGLASIINATTPIFTVLVAGVLLADERLSLPKLVGVFLGLLGTLILIGPEVLNGQTGSVLGQASVMGAAISYAFAATYARRFKKSGLSPLIVATGQVTMASLILMPLTLLVDGYSALLTIPTIAIGSIVGLAFFSTVLAYILYFRLIDSAGATNAALVTFLIPVSAISLGVIILGETFSIPHFIGMAVIGAGLITIDGRIFMAFRQTEERMDGQK